MRILHLSDLHIGKKVNEFDMLKDQEHILKEIQVLIEYEQIEAVILAGDIYDKTVPPASAIRIFDDFLTDLSMKKILVLMISGNHDSPERLSFGSRIMENHHIYIEGKFTGTAKKVALEDGYGAINFFLLPFIKPAVVRPFYPEAKIESYEDAMREVIEDLKLDPSERNILLSHQFVTNQGMHPDRSDSEILSLGGMDNIDASMFDAFDYVALGHIHGPQKVGRDMIRYAGSPLKYSFSEARQKKAATIITINEKENTPVIKLEALTPLRDMVIIKGPLAELLSPDNLRKLNQDDYYSVILTDDEEIIDAIGQVRIHLPNIMQLQFENERSRSLLEHSLASIQQVEKKSSLELFEEFYERQNVVAMTDKQKKIIEELIRNNGGKEE